MVNELKEATAVSNVQRIYAFYSVCGAWGECEYFLEVICSDARSFLFCLSPLPSATSLSLSAGDKMAHRQALMDFWKARKIIHHRSVRRRWEGVVVLNILSRQHVSQKWPWLFRSNAGVKRYLGTTQTPMHMNKHKPFSMKTEACLCVCDNWYVGFQ